ncbi:MAG: DUF6783 domain-containing protein [Blautia sp.]
MRQSNEGKYTAKWGSQIAEMVFQTRSSATAPTGNTGRRGKWR